MSSSDEEYNGGHELEDWDAPGLAKIIFGLAAIVLASVFVVVQFFYQQREALEIEDNGARAGYHLQKYWDQMDEGKKGLASVAKGMSGADALKAPKAGPGWVNPDDIKEDK
jgi:hypothetical protein